MAATGKHLALLAAALGLALAAARGADAPGVAIVSMERLFDSYHKTQAATARLKARFAPADRERLALLSAARARQEDLDKARAAALDRSLSEPAREEKRRQAEDALLRLQEADAKLRGFDADHADRFGTEMKASREALVGDIRAAIAAYSRERGIRLVLDSSGKTFNNLEAVVYREAGLDITDAILARLNRDAGRAAAPPDAPAEQKESAP